MALVNGEMERLEKFAGPLGVVQVFNIAPLVIPGTGLFRRLYYLGSGPVLQR